MYKRRSKNSPSYHVRGSDINAPDSTSLFVNRSKVSEDLIEDDVASSVQALLCDEDDDDDVLNRPSTSLIYSMSQKKHSTPQNLSNRRALSECSANINKSKTPTKNKSIISQASLSPISPKKSRKLPIDSKFLDVLRECGAREVNVHGSFELLEDQAKFCLKLNNELKDNAKMKEFVKAMEEYADNFENLKKLVMYTQTSAECDVARGPVQEPMLRLLLLVDSLQATLLQFLLQKMAEMIIDSPESSELSLVSSILRQVRCLNRVQDTKFGCKLFELIEVSPVNIRREIITLLPELILDDEVEYAALQLIELLNAGTDLTLVIMDSLGNLRLSSTMREQIRSKVLKRLDKSPPSFLPSLTQYSLASCDTSNMGQVVSALRQQLPFTSTKWDALITGCSSNAQKRRQVDADISLTFLQFKFSIMASKQLTDAWLRIIQNDNEFRPVDLMILLLIHGHVLGKKQSVITLIKGKIRSGLLTEDIIHQSFKILRVVASENYKELLELSSTLLKSFEQHIADISISLYIEAFRGFTSFLRQDMICDIIPQIINGNNVTVQNSLDLLVRLRDTNKKALEEQAFTLISLLSKLPDLTLLQVRQLVDVLSSIIASKTQQNTGHIDELQTFIRKKLSAWQPDTQKKGIVAVIMLMKHIALSGMESDHECDLLIGMAQGSQGSPATRRGFFFDEFATMLRETDINSPIVTSLRNKVFYSLMDQIFITDLDLEFDHFPMSLQYSIDADDGKLVMPIVAFLVNPPEMNISVINSAIRFVWSAEKQFSTIASMMCASVVLPDSSVFENFLTYQIPQQKMIMDCLFLCANYFIECINALATQKTSEKLIIRLKQLIEVRKLISKHVCEVVDYIPPLFQFYITTSKPVFKKPMLEKKGRGKKRKSNGTEVVEEVLPSQLNSSALPCTSAAVPKEAMAQVAAQSADYGPTELKNYHGYFRDLHCHVFKLLRMELKLSPTKVFKKKKMSDLIVTDVSWSYRPEDKPELGPADVLFLLQDYILKSELILRERPPFVAKKPTFLMTEHKAPLTFLLGSVKLLPKLCNTLDIVSGYCRDLLEANDWIWDAPGMFPKDSSDIKLVFCSVLKIITDILSWRGFQNVAHQQILKDALFALAQMNKESGTQGVFPLALQSAEHLASFANVVPLLSGGVCIVRSMQACLQFSRPPRNMSHVAEICEAFIQRPWFTLTGAVEKGSIYNQQIDSILRTFFASVDDKLQTVHRIAALAEEEVPFLTSKDSTMKTFKALTKSNFPLMYRSLAEALVSACSDQLIENKEDDEACIAVWSLTTQVLMILVNIAKIHTSRTNLAALLKRSQSIIQLFLSKGLPVMETALRIKSDEVLKVLKSLQSVTRFLHSVCCHSKLTSDALVAAHVPSIRSLCERLTLEVKGMVILNKLPLDCISIAVLKNRDIQGNDIVSQTTISTSDDDSELPPEDETDPPEVETEVTIDEEESNSDIF